MHRRSEVFWSSRAESHCGGILRVLESVAAVVGAGRCRNDDQHDPKKEECGGK